VEYTFPIVSWKLGHDWNRFPRTSRIALFAFFASSFAPLREIRIVSRKGAKEDAKNAKKSGDAELHIICSEPTTSSRRPSGRRQEDTLNVCAGEEI
jgi:hypothetical protein